MGFQGSGLGKHGQGMKEPIKPIWRSKFEGLGFVKRERSNVAHDRSDLGSTTGSNKSCASKESISCSHYSKDGHTKDKCWDLHPCSIYGFKSHSEEPC